MSCPRTSKIRIAKCQKCAADVHRHAADGRRARRFALNRLSLVALLLVVALYVAARLWRLDATCLWFDELFGVHAARHTWGGMLRFVAADLIHPPLFYALLKIWVAAGGESLLWLRLFPALTSFAAIVPFLLLARELRLGAKEVTLALLLMAANGYLIKYAQEVRMYSLLLLLTLSSLWLFVRFSKAGRKTRGTLLALFAVNLLLVYTHYYGWLVVAVETLFVLFRNRGKLPSFLFGVAALRRLLRAVGLRVLRGGGRGRRPRAEHRLADAPRRVRPLATVRALPGAFPLPAEFRRAAPRPLGRAARLHPHHHASRHPPAAPTEKRNRERRRTGKNKCGRRARKRQRER